MTFTRTKSGLANYNYFFRSSLIIYTEGRCETNIPIEDETRADYKFYLSLAKEFSGLEEIKIKLVGNKKNALDYHTKIIKQNIPNSLVFVDKDYDGLIYFPSQSPKLLTTYGYSWENDFWSMTMCERTLTVCSATHVISPDFEVKLKRSLHRLGKISALNAAAHSDGRSVFPTTGNSKGVNFSLTSPFPLPKNEVARIYNKIPYTSMCEVMKGIFQSGLKLPPVKIIQGHLFEYVCLLFIGFEYKKTTGTKLQNTEILKNVALSNFINSPRTYLSNEAVAHYEHEFNRA